MKSRILNTKLNIYAMFKTYCLYSSPLGATKNKELELNIFSMYYGLDLFEVINVIFRIKL